MQLQDQKLWMRGFGIFLAALLALAVLDVMAKDLVQRNSAPLVNLVRYIVVLLMALSVVWKSRVPVSVGHILAASEKVGIRQAGGDF